MDAPRFSPYAHMSTPGVAITAYQRMQSASLDQRRRCLKTAFQETYSSKSFGGISPAIKKWVRRHATPWTITPLNVPMSRSSPRYSHPFPRDIYQTDYDSFTMNSARRSLATRVLFFAEPGTLLHKASMTEYCWLYG